MVPTVDLVTVPGDQNTEIAEESLEALKGVIDVQVYVCPPEVSKRMIVPFVRDEKGYKYPGIKKIQAFIQQRLKQANS